MGVTFKFFASLKLAVALIIALAAVISVGTLIESSHGTEAAQVLVYRRPWFGFLLALLALNLFASALERLPWKKKHIGFLTTHLGIILLLIGSMVTVAFGIEGQLVIEEGKTEGRISLDRPLVELFSTDSEFRWTYDFRPVAFPWSGRKELESSSQSPLRIYLLNQYPKAEAVEEVHPKPGGNPALHFSLQGSMAAGEHWLFLDDLQRSQISLGPAVARFARDPIVIDSSPKKKAGRLKFTFEDGKIVSVPVEERNLTKVVPLEGTPYRLQIARMFKNAAVEGKSLVEKPGAMENPAVQLTLEGNGFSEQHTVFAKFPDFPTQHGMKPSQAGVRILYEAAGSSGSPKNELRFVFQKDSLPKFQVKKGETVTDGTVELGKEVATGWMDIQFSVDQYLKEAELHRVYRPLPSGTTRTDTTSSIQTELAKGDERETLWLAQGETRHISLGGKDYHLVYGLRTLPIGFQIELKDFLVDTDPGTERPASFKSEVILKDVQRGIHRDVLIQMNEPLKHRGFKVYQSGYQQTPGAPDISIFTVAKDPGNPLKYAGAIVMVSGFLMLFYIKPLSTLKTSDPKLRRK